MSAHLPVGIFDSGIGGLTLVKEIRHHLPFESLLYVADSEFAPYGVRSKQEVSERSLRVTEWLISRGAKAIVVACNTATAAAIDVLRETFSVPVIGMEPAVKPAASMTETDVVGVLATAGTLESDRFARLVDRHGQEIRILRQQCRDWVKLVESGDLASDHARGLVAEQVEPLVAAGADVLVLGCTHFPLLAPLIKETAGPGVELLDPAEAVVKRLFDQLTERDLVSPCSIRGTLNVWKTGRDELAPFLLHSLTGQDTPVNSLLL